MRGRTGGAKRVWLFLVATTIATVVLFVPKISMAANKHDVVFYEIMWAGSSVSSSDEWLVLKNNTEIDIDIDDWQITRLSSGSDKKMIDLSGSIPANKYFLISNYKKEDSIINLDPDIVNSSVSLANSDMQLKLYDGDFTKGANIVDVADDGEGSPMAGSNDVPKSSMIRAWPLEDGDQQDSWVTNTAQYNLDDRAEELATPGVGVPSIEINEWSDIETVGNDFVLKITVYHPDSDNLTIYNNDIEIASGLKSGDSVELTSSCGDYQGDLLYKLKVVDDLGLSSTVDKSVFCYRQANLIINEVMPAPNRDYNKDGSADTSDEWIEIYNPTKYNINLDRWQINDRTSYYQFDNNISIPAGGYCLLYHDVSKLSLNDSGDSLALTPPAGTQISRTSWSESQKGNAWALLSNTYKWTAQPTPGAKNIYKNTSSSINEPSRPTNIPTIKTGDAKNHINQWIQIEGEVVKTSGNTFYIDDGSGAVKVYIQEKTGIDKPKMYKGYTVKVIGIMNIYRAGSEPRLLPRQQSDIEITSSNTESTSTATNRGGTGSQQVSAGGEGKSASVKTTETRISGGNKLVALATSSTEVSHIKTFSSEYENEKNQNPLSPFEKPVVQVTVGAVGLLALARVGLSVVWLLL